MLKERNITIVASTPYLDEVRQCERVAFLSEGHVMGIDTPEIILDRYKGIFNPPRPTPKPLPVMEGSGPKSASKSATGGPRAAPPPAFAA